MASQADAHSLFEAGHYRETLVCLRSAAKSRSLDASEEIVLADVLRFRGELDSALSIAQRLASRISLLTNKQRSSVHHTLAQCYFFKGNCARGTEHYRLGIEWAQKSGELFEECRLRVHLFLDQVRWQGAPYTDSSLEELRRKLHQIGDPGLAVEFQLGLTEMASQLALFPRAHKHLEIARALLPKVANRAIQTRFKHTEMALAGEAGHLSEALRLGLELCDADDVDITRTHLPITIGHLLIAQARFDEARIWLENALKHVVPGGGAEVACRDTMMLLALCEQKLDEAGYWEESIERLLGTTELRESYYGLCYLLTRIRYLYDLDRIDEGLAVAIESLPMIRKRSIRRLDARMQLMIAEGFALTRRTSEGARMVVDTLALTPDPSCEILAESCRVMGLLVAADSPLSARDFYSRAENLYRTQGNFAAALRLGRELRQPLNIDTEAQVEGHSFSNLLEGGVARWGARVAGILQLGAYPELLGAEIIALIGETECATRAELIEIEQASARQTVTRYVGRHDEAARDVTGIARIKLGTYRTRAFELEIRPLNNSLAHSTILAIRRIAEAATAMAKWRANDLDHEPLWPVQPADLQLGLICASDQMLGLVGTIRRIATSSTVTVLLTGETGVGKELFARAVHQASTRSDRVFLPFNCSTVPRDMVDSQLFGHKRGSFTGAVGDSAGVIRSAAGGTLFLDEIGEMSLETQPKLLRFLESGEILPLGETKPHIVDVRVVAATNANLDQLVAEGRFREDLYYRLNVIRINIPPLRERREEIPALVEHFLERFGRELQKPMLRIADETLEYLVLYRWPGNVRQLANEIRRLVAMAEPGSIIMPAHLADEIAASRRTVPAHSSPRLFNEVVTRIDQPLAAAVDHVERAAIQRALSMTDGRLDEAARMLGLSRKGLYLKRQRLGLG